MAKPVSQSRTMWVPKGTIVGGKKVKKGYVAQYGKPERRVTGKIRLEVATPKRGKKGDVVSVTKGRYKAPSSSKGSARTSTGGRVPEVTKLPKTVGASGGISRPRFGKSEAVYSKPRTTGITRPRFNETGSRTGSQTLQVPGGISFNVSGGTTTPSTTTRTNKPKVGARRRAGAYGGYEVWNGTRWVKEK